MIVEDLLAELRPRCAGQTVMDVRIGLGYTAVRLDGGGCGLAYTFRDEAAPGCNVLREAGRLAGRPAMELAEWCTRFNAIEAAVGVATLNAVVEAPECARVDVLEALRLTPEDVVGMVGFFGPLVDPLRKAAKELFIFERRSGGDGVLPDWAASQLLPRCGVVILSATSIINRTLDALLGYCRGAREVVLLGPSTPMLPGLFGQLGMNILSGVEVTDPGLLLRIVSEGGGTRRFQEAVDKVTIRIR